LDDLIKTPYCDQLFPGIPFDDTLGVGVVQTLPNSISIIGPGLSLGPVNIPTSAPLGFAYGTGTEPPLFQMTLIKQGPSATVVGLNYNQDTIDFQVALKKVDSTGKALPGAPWEIKDYSLNLWVGSAAKAVMPYTALSPGGCTYKPAVILTGPNINANCVAAGSAVTVSWTQAPGNFASAVTPTNPATWATAVGPLAPDVTSTVFTTLAGDFTNAGVTLTVNDPLAGSVTQASSAGPPPFLQSYNPPTIPTLTISPSTFYSSITSVQVTIVTADIIHDALGVAFPAGAQSVSIPATAYNAVLPIPSDNTYTLPLTIGSAVPGQTFPITVNAVNPCGVPVSATAILTSTN
jgi:hypothetical protein